MKIFKHKKHLTWALRGTDERVVELANFQMEQSVPVLGLWSHRIRSESHLIQLEVSLLGLKRRCVRDPTRICNKTIWHPSPN